MEEDEEGGNSCKSLNSLLCKTNVEAIAFFTSAANVKNITYEL